MGNFPRIEARYYDIDLMDASLRKVLNLTYAWLIDLIGGSEQWEEDYAPIFRDYEAEGQHEDFDYVDLPVGADGKLMLGGI